MKSTTNAVAMQNRDHASPTVAPPLPLNLAEANSLSGAVDRFLARDEIGETFYVGSNGPVASLPGRPEARLALLKRLPSATQCWKLQGLIEEELSTPARPADVAATLRQLIGAWPNASKLGSEFHAAMISIVGEEAVSARWPRAAIVGGIVRLLKTATFAPSIAEIIEAVRAEKTRLHEAALLAGQVAETVVRIEDKLVASGHLSVEDEE